MVYTKYIKNTTKSIFNETNFGNKANNRSKNSSLYQYFLYIKLAYFTLISFIKRN